MALLPTWKAIGERGSWFASVKNERLPCVHQHWTHVSDGQMIYDDPGCDAGQGKWVDFLRSLEEKRRVILTRDITEDDKRFERQGYIGLFKIGDVEISDGHLRFVFQERIAHISS